MDRRDNDEMDLGMLYERLRTGYHKVLITAYNLFKFVLSSWIIIAVLLIVGIGYGWYKDSNPEKGRTTEVIVQINYGSANYIYDAVDQFQNKVSEKDTTFLKSLGLYNNKVNYIGFVEIEPIVNLIDIIDKTRESDRNLEVILDEAQYEDELLKSEVFIPEYKIHRIKIKGHYWSNRESIDKFIAYLNKGESLERIKKVAKENLKFRIEENKKSIAYMDSLFKVYGKPIQYDTGQYGNNAFLDINLTNFHLLFEQKAVIMQKNQALEIEYANANNTVEVLNRPMLTIKKSFFDKKQIIYPVMLLFLFFMVSTLIYFYKKAKQLSEKT